LEIQGQTYELGGPHQLTMLEIYEIVFNMLNIKTKLAYVNPNWAMKVAEHIYNWEMFGQ
jgi:hypothetical protein